MKHIVAALALLVIFFQSVASANMSNTIPPFHWTYHSLSALSASGLIEDKVIPGESVFTPEDVVSMIIVAVERASGATKFGETELSSLRQLTNAYRPYFKDCGYDYNEVRSGIELAAIKAGLSSTEDEFGFIPNEEILSARAAVSINKFTIDLYKRASIEQGRGSFFISPFSAASLLSAVYAGAGGKTAAEMEKVLYLTSDTHKNIGALIKELNSASRDTTQICAANAVWPAKQEKILPEFEQILSDYYGATLNPLNYRANPDAARNAINRWTEKETRHKIKNIADSCAIDKETLMVLTNAIYFKSSWLEKFDPADTIVSPFWIGKDTSSKVLMMSRLGKDIDYADIGNAEIISLPYQDKKFSMLVALPKIDSNIAEFEANFDTAKLAQWVAMLEPRKVRVYLPKFKNESDFDLSKTLAKMGMPSAFNPYEADFSGITGDNNVYIGSVLHKAFIENSEEGTEAAAATAVIMMRASLEIEDEVTFRADHPFIYLIRDNSTGAFLFIGRYTGR